jgi:hypothetical protein
MTNPTAALSKIAGYPVELTIRGERAFTFSFDAADRAAGERVAAFFAAAATVSVDVDDECGTCVYVNI